jgi:hypothetical protein
MKIQAGKLLPLAIISLLALSTAPTAFASTLTVTLNPATKVAEFQAVSMTNIVLTYPANSTLSSYLKDVNSSVVLSGTFEHGSDGVQAFQGGFHQEDPLVGVNNMSVSVDNTAVGNATTLVIHKATNITAWVTGVFTVVNGTVEADLRWRSFVIPGALDLDFAGHPGFDVNLVGSAFQYSLATRITALQFLVGGFGGYGIWSRPTLNYSALSSPLSTWTMNYDKATNTTTYSKTISGSASISSMIDVNGQKYTLTASSDPSAAISVKGYASASSDSLTIQSGPTASSLASSSSFPWVAAAIGVVVVIGAAAYLALRSKSRPKIANISTLQ